MDNTPKQFSVARPARAGLAEGAEDRKRDGIFFDLPLGMPLHSQGVARRVADRDGFDQSVVGPCLRRQALAEAVEPLRMERVDPGGGQPRLRCEDPTGREGDVVGRAVLHFDRIVRVFLVEVEAGHVVDGGMQGAPEGDVQLLEATTDRQERNRRVGGGGYQL